MSWTGKSGQCKKTKQVDTCRPWKDAGLHGGGRIMGVIYPNIIYASKSIVPSHIIIVRK